jgi:hypothetical protein
MSSYNSGSVTAYTTTSANLRTASPIVANQVGAATNTLGTVGAGKKWRVFNICINCTCNTINHGKATILLNDVEVCCAKAIGLAAVTSNNTASFVGSYDTAFILTAGQTVKFTTTGSGTDNEANVYYFEEAA